MGLRTNREILLLDPKTIWKTIYPEFEDKAIVRG